MSLELRNLKKEYLRNILTVSLSNRDYSTVVLRASFPLDDIRDILEELKKELNIVNLIILDFDADKIKTFYETNPSEIDIEKFISRFPEPIGNIKFIYFENVTDTDSAYHDDYANRYFKDLRKYNEELFKRIDNKATEDVTVTACPNKKWAESLLGSQNKLDELWLKISKTLLSPDALEKDIKEKVERKNELNKMKIRNLNFYTNLGTDLRIALNPHSIWCCEPNNIDGKTNYFNYPSYEIYTSPDCYSAEGKIVLSRKEKFYYDIMVEKAIFEFAKGRLISCKSNNENFDGILLNKPNKMNRIGEIALVSEDSPLAQLEDFYNSLLLDENSGCHFALGYYIRECANIAKEKIDKNGARCYHYNTSLYHTDLVFGNESITVEAETKDKKKILIMDQGKWQI